MPFTRRNIKELLDDIGPSVRGEQQLELRRRPDGCAAVYYENLAFPETFRRPASSTPPASAASTRPNATSS